MIIHCCECNIFIEARLTNGEEIYPHRIDLYKLPFWICDKCSNYVGCHHKTKNRTMPLGSIPTPELRKERRYMHSILDPIWKSGKMKRKDIYAMISKKIGRDFHTADIRTTKEALEIFTLLDPYI
jgi:hypothetical protein